MLVLLFPSGANICCARLLYGKYDWPKLVSMSWMEGSLVMKWDLYQDGGVVIGNELGPSLPYKLTSSTRSWFNLGMQANVHTIYSNNSKRTCLNVFPGMSQFRYQLSIHALDLSIVHTHIRRYVTFISLSELTWSSSTRLTLISGLTWSLYK